MPTIEEVRDGVGRIRLKHVSGASGVLIAYEFHPDRCEIALEASAGTLKASRYAFVLA